MRLPGPLFASPEPVNRTAWHHHPCFWLSQPPRLAAARFRRTWTGDDPAATGGTPHNERQAAAAGWLYQDDHDALTTGPEIEATVDGTPSPPPAAETGFTTSEPISALVLSSFHRQRHY
ncbi:MAG: hypothetical protein R3D55_05345 [Chloroflexota bacterium]